MDIILTSSRGKGLESYMREHYLRESNRLRVEVVKSATYDKLLERLKSIWKKLGDEDKENCHVYFFAGLCDVTYRDYDPDFYPGTLYDEVIYNEIPSATAYRVYMNISDVDREVRLLGAEPIFCTIIPCSLRVWNYTRLTQHKTAFLLHHAHYDDMQHLLIETIQKLNILITNHNVAYHKQTPHTADTIIHNMGDGKKRVRYGKLTDGVHAGSIDKTRMEQKSEKKVLSLTEIWALKITASIHKNRKLSKK